MSEEPGDFCNDCGHSSGRHTDDGFCFAVGCGCNLFNPEPQYAPVKLVPVDESEIEAW